MTRPQPEQSGRAKTHTHTSFDHSPRDAGPLIQERAREKLDGMVEWLIRVGFPWDVAFSDPAPGFLLDELAVRHSEAWGSTGDAAAALLEAQDFEGRGA